MAQAEQMTAALRTGSETESTMQVTGKFLFERAEKEYEAAGRKREAAMTKAGAIATLAVALAAVAASPALDTAGLAHGASRVTMLVATACFVAAIGCAVQVFRIRVEPGERVSRRELENWTSEEFWLADVAVHHLDLTKAFVRLTDGQRRANERAEAWMNWAVLGVGVGLALMLLAFVVEAM